MTAGLTEIGRRRFAVPGNRWDLVGSPLSAPGCDVVVEGAATTEVVVEGAATTEIVEAADVSVIVPFFENQHDLDLLLAGLALQTHPLSRLQIVIADDGSAAPPMVPEIAGNLDITTVRQHNEGFRAGAARNLGVTAADGHVILFLDGDTIPDPGYVRALSRLPAVLPDAVVSGRRRYADLSGWSPSDLAAWFGGRRAAPPEWEEPVWMTREYRRTEDLLSVHPRSYQYLIGAVLGCSREIFDDIDGFDETITGYGGEDYDFTYRAFNAGAVFAHVPEALGWHDGPDWAGRTPPGQQTPQKNREVAMLAQRIPEPSMRGQGQIYSTVDVLVTVHTAGWSLGAAVMCLRSLLSTLDCLVLIDSDGSEQDDVLEAFRDDPRVRRLPPDRILDRRLTDRARIHVDVFEAVSALPAFAGELSRMVEEDVGTLTITRDTRTIATAETTRLRRRSARHGALPDSIRQTLFPSRTLDADSSGLDFLVEEPRLAAVFGGYA